MTKDSTALPMVAKSTRKTSPSISAAAYAAALVEAAKAAERLAEPCVVDRLHRDQSGEALAAVNQLRASHKPEIVLEAVITAVSFATSIKDIRDYAKEEAVHARRQVEEVKRFMGGPAADYSDQLSHSLKGLLEYWEMRARGCEIAPAMLFLPKKIESAGSKPKVALRMLRDQLFPRAEAPHQPLQRLIAVALGEAIAADIVKEALRKGNSIQAMAEAQFPAPPSGDKGG